MEIGDRVVYQVDTSEGRLTEYLGTIRYKDPSHYHIERDDRQVGGGSGWKGYGSLWLVAKTDKNLKLINPKENPMAMMYDDECVEKPSIVDFAKSLLLSKDEKAMRVAGLKDSCGEYTGAAKDLVLNKLVAENEAYLIDIAKKMAEEMKKK